MLARREHSAFELTQKLNLKGYPRELVEDVVRALAERGLQSDERFTESFVRSRYGRGLGPVRVAQELRLRGISADLAAAYLNREDDGWGESCAGVAERRFGSAPPRDARERAKRIRFLQYRGFSMDQIRRVLNGCGEEPTTEDFGEDLS